MVEETHTQTRQLMAQPGGGVVELQAEIIISQQRQLLRHPLGMRAIRVADQRGDDPPALLGAVDQLGVLGEGLTHHIRQASDAISKGVPIGQVAELRRKAIGALKKAKTELGEGSATTLDGGVATSSLTDVIEAEQDLAPAKYRGLNADYYKKLNEEL